MTVHLPPGLQKLLEVTVGQPWPEGDEDGLRAMSAACREFQQTLDVTAEGLVRVTKRLPIAMAGTTADAAMELIGQGLPDCVRQAAEQVQELAKITENAAADIQKAKIMIGVMLVVLAATIAELLASLFGSFLIPTVVGAARVGIGAILKQLMAKVAEAGAAKIAGNLALNMAKYAAINAGTMTGLDAAIQLGQMAAHERSGMDWSALKQDLVGGAIGGAAFGAFRGLGKGVGSALADISARIPKAYKAFGLVGYTFLQGSGVVLSGPLVSLANGNPGKFTLNGVFGVLGKPGLGKGGGPKAGGGDTVTGDTATGGGGGSRGDGSSGTGAADHHAGDTGGPHRAGSDNQIPVGSDPNTGNQQLGGNSRAGSASVGPNHSAGGNGRDVGSVGAEGNVVGLRGETAPSRPAASSASGMASHAADAGAIPGQPALTIDNGPAARRDSAAASTASSGSSSPSVWSRASHPDTPSTPASTVSHDFSADSWTSSPAKPQAANDQLVSHGGRYGTAFARQGSEPVLSALPHVRQLATSIDSARAHTATGAEANPAASIEHGARPSSTPELAQFLGQDNGLSASSADHGGAQSPASVPANPRDSATTETGAYSADSRTASPTQVLSRPAVPPVESTGGGTGGRDHGLPAVPPPRSPMRQFLQPDIRQPVPAGDTTAVPDVQPREATPPGALAAASASSPVRTVGGPAGVVRRESGAAGEPTSPPVKSGQAAAAHGHSTGSRLPTSREAPSHGSTGGNIGGARHGGNDGGHVGTGHTETGHGHAYSAQRADPPPPDPGHPPEPAPAVLPDVRLPDFVRHGQALGLVTADEVHGVDAVTARMTTALGVKGHADYPEIASALHGDFETFLGDGRAFPAVVDGKPGEVVIAVRYARSADNASDAETAGTQPAAPKTTMQLDMQVQGARKTESTAVQTGPMEIAVTASTMGMPHGVLGSIGVGRPLPHPVTRSGIGTTVTDMRSSRGGKSSAQHRVPVEFSIYVIDSGERITPVGTVAGSVRLRIPDDISQMRYATGGERPKAHPADDQRWWLAADTFMPEAVTDATGLFDALRQDLPTKITGTGSPARTELRRFVASKNIRAQLRAMTHDWVYSGDLVAGGGKSTAARMRVSRTETPVLVGTADKLKMRLHDQSAATSTLSSTLQTGTDVQAGLGFGGTVGNLLNMSVQGVFRYGYRKLVTTQDGSTASQRQGYEISGRTSLYRVRTFVEVQVPGKPPREVPMTSYVRLETAEAAELGLAVPRDAPGSAISRSAIRRYPPPYLAAGVAAGHVTVGRFTAGRELNAAVSAALRADSRLRKLLPEFDPPEHGEIKKPTDEQLANQRELATALSDTNLSTRMPSGTGPGIPIDLIHVGASATDRVRIRVKARLVGPAEHLGQSSKRKVRGSAGDAAKIDAAGGSQRGGSIGPEGRVVIGPGRWRLGPLFSAGYVWSKMWRNSGGPISERVSLNVGGNTAHAFRQRLEFDVEITRVSQSHLTGAVTRTMHPVGEHAKVSTDAVLWVPEANTSTEANHLPHPDSGRPEGTIRRDDMPVPRDPSHLLTTPRPAPRILHVEAIGGTEQIRAAVDSALTRASGGDPVLTLPGTDSARRLDHLYSPEALAAKFTRWTTTALPAPGLRWNRRVRRDRVGGVAMSAALSNPVVIAVSDDMGTENSHKGGVSAADEQQTRRGLTASGGLAATSGMPTRDAFSGLFTGSVRWGKLWIKGRGAEVSGTVERNRVTPNHARTVLVRWDMDVTISAQGWKRYLVGKWPKTVAGERVFVPGGAYVRMTEQEAKKYHLLAETDQQPGGVRTAAATNVAPVAAHLPSGGRRGYLGVSHVEPTVNLTKLVARLRTRLGPLGPELLPESILNDTQFNSARLLTLTGYDSVAALVDDAFDGGVSLPLPRAGWFGTGGYRAMLTATATRPPRHVDTVIDDGTIENFVSSTAKSSHSEGTATTLSGGAQAVPIGTPHAQPNAAAGSVGAAAAGLVGRTDTKTATNHTTDLHSGESRAKGAAAKYELPTVFTLTVLHGDTEIASVSSAEQKLSVRLHADDTSTTDTPATGYGVSRPLRFDLSRGSETMIADWQRNAGHPHRFDPPSRFTSEGFVGAKETHEAAVRALRAAGAHSSFVDAAEAPGMTLAGSTTSTALRANLPRTNRPAGWRLPDLHERAIVTGQDVSVTVYTRMSNPRLAAVSDSVNFENPRSVTTGTDNQSTSALTAYLVATAPQWRAAPHASIAQGNQLTRSPATSGGVHAQVIGGRAAGSVVGSSANRIANVKPSSGRSVGVRSDLDILVVAEVRNRLTGQVKRAAYEVTSLGGARVGMALPDAPTPFRELPEALAHAQNVLAGRAKAWQAADAKRLAGEHRMQDRALRGEAIHADGAAEQLRRAQQVTRAATARLRQAEADAAAAIAEARRHYTDAFDALRDNPTGSECTAAYGETMDTLVAAMERVGQVELDQQANIDAARANQRDALKALAHAKRVAGHTGHALAAQARLRQAAEQANAAWYAAKAEVDRQKDAFNQTLRDHQPAIPRVPGPVDGDSLSAETVERFYGIVETNQKGIQEFVDKFDEVIDVRPSNPESVRWLKAGAYPKPESIKAKTINDLDVILGAPSDKRGLVGFFVPRLPEQGEISPGAYQRIKDRYEQRAREYATLGPKMDELQRDGEYRVSDGVVYFRTPSGDYRPIAGDHDLFHIHGLDGRMLPTKEYDKIVTLLVNRHIGVQHGAHMYWAPKGDFERALYKAIVDRHGIGGEPLVRFSPGKAPELIHADWLPDIPQEAANLRAEIERLIAQYLGGGS